jgi:5-deoxy-5-amino-3-dehydroquinate synthase
MSGDAAVHRVEVPLGERSYEVLVGRGVRAHAGSMVPSGVRRVAVVTQEGVPAALRPDLGDRPVSTHVLPAGEEHKNLSTVERLCREFSREGLSRADLIVSVGGGLVSDVAGFAAACYHRGTPVMHLPTTLLGMVDAAIGGKTGVNIPEGKNLIGAFWQPVSVLCDTEALDTLPLREMRCGTGEMAKYHFISGDNLSSLPMEQRIAVSVSIKATIVAEDEREGGRRALLNYGHTLAHALETVTGYGMAHGEAVGVGLVFAAELARDLGRIDDARVDAHRHVVREVYGLDDTVPPGCDPGELLAAMSRDKKALGSLTFVLDSARGLEVVRDVSRDRIAAVLERFILRQG